MRTDRMQKLTKRVVEEFKIPEGALSTTGKPITQAFLWDCETRGFGVRVSRDGKRSFIVQGRVNGRELRLTVGRHGVETVEQARENARECLRGMRLGIDPRAVAKERAAQSVSLRDVADAYMRDRPLKASSKAEIERHVTTTFAAWLKKPVASITRESVSKRFNEIKSQFMVEGGYGHTLYEMYRVDKAGPVGQQAAYLSSRYYNCLRGVARPQTAGELGLEIRTFMKDPRAYCKKTDSAFLSQTTRGRR